jgi:hypothetical protein
MSASRQWVATYANPESSEEELLARQLQIGSPLSWAEDLVAIGPQLTPTVSEVKPCKL